MVKMIAGSYQLLVSLISSRLNHFIHIYTAHPMVVGRGVEIGCCHIMLYKMGVFMLSISYHIESMRYDPRHQLKNVCTM